LTGEASPASTDVALRRLVDRAARHDPDAWEALYRRAYRPLFGFARRRLFDDKAAEDAVSETMARALDNIERFTWRGGGFDAWLWGIARNVVRELQRSRHRTLRLVHEDRPSTDRSPEDHAVAGAETAAMRTAFGRLDPHERELLELRIHAGLSSDEVGQLLGKRPGAVRMGQARALQRLRTILEEVQGG
jgi:RNA polymerase sigma-70 factor (ECF subfamily)